ncbi:hypothetical protein [Rhodococcus ruber]
MSEQQDIIGHLQSQGVLGAICWAYDSAVGRALDDYSEDAGYDLTWLGNTRHTLFRDRLDRVFACGRYALGGGVGEDAGLDLVNIELTKRDIDSMPDLPGDLVRRVDLNRSPGWAIDGVRFLLTSCEFGGIDTLSWIRKSRTKQCVAKQPTPEPQPTLFDALADQDAVEVPGVAESVLELATFVVAHSLDAVNGRRELVFGRPRLNVGGGQAWYWQENLLATPPAPGGRRLDPLLPSGPDGVPDAAVRLRRDAFGNPQMGDSSD